MIDSQVKTGAILTVGNASPLKGHSKAYSLYAGSGQWTSKTVLPETLSDYQAVSHKTHVYVIGGQKGCNSSDTCAGTQVNTVYQYDTKLDKYTEKAVIKDNDVAAIRYRYASAVVGDKIYIIAGYQSFEPINVLDTVEVLDTAAASPAWTSAPSLPAKRGDITCASSGGKVYAIGGYYDPTGNWKPTAFHDTMFEFTPGAAAWAEKAKMPSSRGDKAAVTMSDGSIIVIGGETHAREEQSQVAAHPAEQYYPAHDTWVAKASIPTARFRFD